MKPDVFLHYENRLAIPDQRRLFLIFPNLSKAADYGAIKRTLGVRSVTMNVLPLPAAACGM